MLISHYNLFLWPSIFTFGYILTTDQKLNYYYSYKHLTEYEKIEYFKT
jgi:hypothetical protein